MAEENTTAGEEATPNSEQTETKTTFTLEEVEAMKKEMQSNSEKGVQKLIAEKKESERVATLLPKAIGKVAEDNAYLIELSESDPKLAKIILESYYDGMDIDAYKKSIDFKENLADPKVVEKRIETEAKRLADKRIVQKDKEAFIEKLKMSDEEKTKFEEAFAERMELKTFKAEDVQKHLEKAYREIDGTLDLKTLNNQTAIANAMATGDGKGGDGGTKGKPALNQEVSEFLSKFS